MHLACVWQEPWSGAPPSPAADEGPAESQEPLVPLPLHVAADPARVALARQREPVGGAPHLSSIDPLVTPVSVCPELLRSSLRKNHALHTCLTSRAYSPHDARPSMYPDSSSFLPPLVSGGRAKTPCADAVAPGVGVGQGPRRQRTPPSLHPNLPPILRGRSIQRCVQVLRAVQRRSRWRA